MLGVILIGATARHNKAKQSLLIFLKCTHIKQSDGALRTTWMHF
jgi:hypothetical protein